VAKRRTGRVPLIRGRQKEEVIEEFEEPGRAQRTFWTASAFHGHITEKYALECSYTTVLRLLHEKGYVLKVPKPWPDRQDEALRQEFLVTLHGLVEDADAESGMEMKRA
jgi:transposase